MIRFTATFFLAIVVSCSCIDKSKKIALEPEHLVVVLDTIWQTEQTPIRLRDSLGAIYGVESEKADVYQKEYRKNLALNIKKNKEILGNYTWPELALVGEQGNLTICNVLNMQI